MTTQKKVSYKIDIDVLAAVAELARQNDQSESAVVRSLLRKVLRMPIAARDGKAVKHNPNRR